MGSSIELPKVRSFPYGWRARRTGYGPPSTGLYTLDIRTVPSRISAGTSLSTSTPSVLSKNVLPSSNPPRVYPNPGPGAPLHQNTIKINLTDRSRYSMVRGIVWSEEDVGLEVGRV